jgi:hypothetical protein
MFMNESKELDQKPDVCVYCGSEESLTVDHIPPKLLLARPYPDNLPTVPACQKCNASFQTNDEYIRFAAAIDTRAAKHNTVRTKMPAILRSLSRPEAKGFATHLANQLTDSVVLGADGKPLGQSFDPDRTRLNASGERLVRGLFFLECGKPLPPSVPIRIAARPGIVPSDPAIQHFSRMYASCPDRRTGETGEAFSYAAAFYPEYSIWLMLLYDHFSWLATIKYANP